MIKRNLGDILKAVFKRIGKIIYLRREHIMFVGDMTESEWYKRGELPPKYKPLIDVEIRQGTVDDLDKFKGVVSRKKIRTFRDWFNKGYDLFVVLHKGRIIYYHWLCFSEFYNSWLGLNVKPEDDETIPVDLYNDPEFRMKKIHLAVEHELVLHCKGKGKYKMKAFCLAENFPLLKLMYKKSKFSDIYPLKKIVYRRFLGFIKSHTFKDIRDSDI